MKRLLSVLTVTILASGYSSLLHASPFAPTERDLAAKAQYYENLNRRHHLDYIDTVAEINAKFESAPAEAERLLEEQGWSKAEYDTVVSQVRADDELSRAFEAARVKAEAVEAMTAAARQ